MNELKISEDPKDVEFLMKTLEVARNNPDKVINKAVGAIVVKEGKILGEGYRVTKVLQEEPYKDITYHAEHNALMQAGGDSEGATIYVTLEPCTYRSKGPGWDAPDPCCKLIADAGIKRVVIGIFDEDFGAGGAKYLLERGIEVCSCKNLDKEGFEKLINNPEIKNENAKRLQNEVIQKIKAGKNEDLLSDNKSEEIQ